MLRALAIAMCLTILVPGVVRGSNVRRAPAPCSRSANESPSEIAGDQARAVLDHSTCVRDPYAGDDAMAVKLLFLITVTFLSIGYLVWFLYDAMFGEADRARKRNGW